VRARETTAPEVSAKEIVASRAFDAPRSLVYRAWIDPDRLGRWWGPKGFTITTDEIEVRPGGLWRFTMHGPDGIDYRNRIMYVEIAEPERLIYDHVSGPRFQAIVTFADETGGRTRLTVRMIFGSAAERDRVAEKFGAVEGLSQTLERLGEHLAQEN
jgi:uncharacterized protein YndB with AHSA1/START domain